MAAIRYVNELHAQFDRRFFKTSRLVSELPGEEQQSFGWRGHVGGVSAPESHKAIRSCQHVFQLWFHAANGNQLIARRFRAAIPRFAEIGNDMFRIFRSGDGRSRESSRGVRSLPDAFGCGWPRFLLALRRRGNLLNGLTQSIRARVSVFPRI